jgi:hypothetical protein
MAIIQAGLRRMVSEEASVPSNVASNRDSKTTGAAEDTLPVARPEAAGTVISRARHFVFTLQSSL